MNDFGTTSLKGRGGEILHGGQNGANCLTKLNHDIIRQTICTFKTRILLHEQEKNFSPVGKLLFIPREGSTSIDVMEGLRLRRRYVILRLSNEKGSPTEELNQEWHDEASG